MKKIIEVEKMTLVLGGRTILNIPEFALIQGESVSLMGPNGAGKSSLLMLMAGLQPPTTGTISFYGTDYKEYNPVDLHRKMAMVFQKPMMLDLTVMENAELGLKFRGVPRKLRHEKIRPWLERLGVAHLEKRRARSLSGGEAQRVVLAQTMVLEPEIIFLDEPFSNLDKEIRDELLEETGKLLSNGTTTTVLVTHHRKEARALTDTVYFVEDGRIAGVEELAASGVTFGNSGERMGENVKKA